MVSARIAAQHLPRPNLRGPLRALVLTDDVRAATRNRVASSLIPIREAFRDPVERRHLCQRIVHALQRFRHVAGLSVELQSGPVKCLPKRSQLLDQSAASGSELQGSSPGIRCIRFGKNNSCSLQRLTGPRARRVSGTPPGARRRWR